MKSPRPASSARQSARPAVGPTVRPGSRAPRAARKSTVATVADVARVAQVSSATVSRALNQPEVVRAELRQRIEAAIVELGYVPDAGARALSTKRSGTIGAVIPTIDNAIFAKGIEALQKYLDGQGYQLLVAVTEYDLDVESRQALDLVARGVDGLIFMGNSQLPALAALLKRRALPCVHVGVPNAPSGAPVVGFDNQAAAARATRFVLDLGHREIAMLAGITKDNDRARARLGGVRQALKEVRLPLPAHRVVEKPYNLAAAREGLRELLAHNPPPTAVLCGNDVLAFGALMEAARQKVKVPRDLSIVGFDDLELARHLEPALTTMHVPTEEMWRVGGERLLAMIHGEKVPAVTEVEVRLVVRESTARVS